MQKISLAFLHPLLALKFVTRSIFKKAHLKYLIHRGNFFDIPIYIISYNRLEYLRQTIGWLEKYGYKNITVIDNYSDYGPLLEFYKTCGHKIIRMQKNYGHTVFYKSPRFWIKRLLSFYILTDPDLSPIENCLGDFVEQFMKIMADYPNYQKVGFSLKADDLPNTNQNILYEAQFWKYPIDNSVYPYKIYDADIDTTFALNSPSIYTYNLCATNAIRTGVPYQVRHLPWYIEDIKKIEELDDETINYVRTSTDVSSWGRSIRKKINDGKKI